MMDTTFYSKESEIDHLVSASNLLGNLDGKVRNSSDDSYVSNSQIMALDGCSGWYDSPETSNQLFSTCAFPSLPSLPSFYGSCDKLFFPEENSAVCPIGDIESGLNVLDKIASHQSDVRMGLPFVENDSNVKQDNTVLQLQSKIPWSLGLSFPERILHSLSLFKESFGDGFLAQVWVPIRDGDSYVLSTYDQPYLLDQQLRGYREVSRSYTFAACKRPGSFLGLPGRVFTSKIPEWTSDVNYYSSDEYLRVDHARDHGVHGSIAIPTFSSAEKSCAILELVTIKEKPNLDAEMDAMCRALEIVNLRTSARPRLLSQSHSWNRSMALAEVADVLRAVCHAHTLPMALTWIPCYMKEDDDQIIMIRASNCNSSPKKKRVLCIEEIACYVNDTCMQGFACVCEEQPLEEGQGVSGKALQSNTPSFCSDVKTLHINEYPLVQHARKFGLTAAVAIRLRSTYTANDDYILEFFLPLNMKGISEQQLLLDSVSVTMQRICRSLRTVSDAELHGSVNSIVEDCDASRSFFPRYGVISSRSLLGQGEINGFDSIPLDAPITGMDSVDAGGCFEQASVLKHQSEKKRSTGEKTVSLSVLQQYFSGSLKDAAKGIGVCPTTLKRICRQHGISRWPSRKINKVNRSLRKIQTVLNSVEGVEGRLKLDPTTGELVATGSVIREFDTCRNLILSNKTPSAKTSETTPSTLNCDSSSVKLESGFYTTGDPFQSDLSCVVSSNGKEQDTSTISGDRVEEFENRSMVVINKMNLRMKNGNEAIQHSQPSTSTMTDSSNGSASMTSTPSSCENSRHFSDKMNTKNDTFRMTIKAKYRDDMVRFKFDPSSGCLQLYEEIAARFKIFMGTFQLKYLDDEEEWVMLVSDSDLQECVELTEFVKKPSIKFLVCDLASSMGSSGSSNCFLVGSS